MDAEKYRREIKLLCPTCGGDQFETNGPPETEHSSTCVSCGREMTREELVRENGESISAHLDEVKGELVADLHAEFSKTLKDAFRGNKFMKIK